MNIDELRSAQSKERQKSDLQQLRESFYGDVAEYVEELEAERERAAERADDPFGSPEVQQLTNDIETAKDTAEAIYERRLGKIVKKASLVSAEMANPNDVSGLTAEEQALFTDLVERIEENKAHMLDVIAGDAPAGPREDATTASSGAEAGTTESTASDAASPERDAERSGVPHPEDGLDDPADAPETGASAGDDRATAGDDGGARAGDEDPRRSEAAAIADVADEPPVDDAASDPADAGGVSAADLMGGDADDEAGDQSPEPSGGREATGDDPATTAGGDDGDRATLRVTENVGEIFGVDEREYTLAAEDVVTLPEENADVLVSQGAAERLD